jgi:hypothetical protein
MAVPTPSTTLPSTYLVGVGTLVEGGAVVSFLGALGLSAQVSAAIVAFGGVLVGLGAWLHSVGH